MTNTEEDFGGEKERKLEQKLRRKGQEKEIIRFRNWSQSLESYGREGKTSLEKAE